MKAKLKFDTAVIKGFFSDHWEKFVVAGSIIVLLFFIVSVFKRETLPSSLQPNQIVAKINTLQLAIGNSQWVEPTDSSLKPTEVPGAIAPLPAGPYSDIPPFIQPSRVFDDPNKRTDPTLLPVLAVQATGGRGAVATGGTGPGIGAGVGPIGAGSRPIIDPTRPQTRPGPSSGPAPSLVSPAPRSTRGRVATPAPAVQPKTPSRPLLGQQQPLAAEAGSPPIPADFELPGAPGGGSAESRHFVIVTGAIPVLDQLKEYDRRFSHARHSEADNAVNFNGPTRSGQSTSGDVPVYIWWRLERVDLTNREEKTVIDYGNVEQVLADRGDNSIGGNLVMSTLKPSRKFLSLNKDRDEWQGSGAEVVPDIYLADSWLSWPLPPILLRDWWREATNPKIPLTPPQATDTPDGTAPSAEPGATKPADSADPFSKQAAENRSTTSQSPVPFPGRSGPAPSVGSSGRGGGFQGRGRDRWARGGVPAQGPATIARPADADAPQVPFKLFRFVDFDVEPGHSYQYRVQLVLKNPNFGLASELLAKPDPKPAPYRDTPWSEASRPATVPLDTQIVAEGVDRPKRGEPKVKAGVLQWDKKDSVELIAKADLDLGAVANFIQKKLTGVVDPVNRAIRDFTADFVSDGALLDMHGGGDDKTAVDGGGPGEMLFLVVGRDGKADQLVVVNQALDKPLIDGWEKTHKVPPEMLNAADASPTFPGSRGPALSGPALSGGLLGRGSASSRESKTPAPKSGAPGK